MKYMIASDIHGSAFYCEKMLECFEKERCDRLLLLGDILYHGPRNDLPDGYAPKEVISLLNPFKNKIMCVRGNCDTEVDQMVLEFPILADYAVIDIGKSVIFATHGHKFNESVLPPLGNADILLTGHTHIPKCVSHGDYTYINPGSVSIPKDGSGHSCIVLENGIFTWKNSDGASYLEYNANYVN